MAANAAAWIAFLIVTPPVPDQVFADIEARRRASMDATIELRFDVPTIVAGRYSGTFGSVNEADRVLKIFAVPALSYAERVRVALAPARHAITLPARGESYAIAALALILSMAFWNALGATVHFWRARRLSRARGLTGRPRCPHHSCTTMFVLL